MKCLLCQKVIQPSRIGGMITITCCNKIQVLKYTIRPALRSHYENDSDIILREIDAIHKI